jgi:hypothetical protein
MDIKHFSILSWVRRRQAECLDARRSTSHEQDGERLSQRQCATASGDPAMAFRAWFERVESKVDTGFASERTRAFKAGAFS